MVEAMKHFGELTDQARSVQLKSVDAQCHKNVVACEERSSWYRGGDLFFCFFNSTNSCFIINIIIIGAQSVCGWIKNVN